MLADYNRNILNFLYELTKQDKYYNYYALSRRINIEGKGRVTPRTITKWFNFLDSQFSVSGIKLNKLYYYPSFFYEKLGLIQVFTFIKGKKLNIFEFQNYTAYLNELAKFNKTVLCAGLVKPEEIALIEKRLEYYKRKKLIKEYFFFSVNKGMHVYSPFHKVINRGGFFDPDKNEEEEIKKQVEKFIKYICDLPKAKLINEVKNNILIALVLFAYTKRHWSSIKVWNKLKEIYGSNIWKYIKKRKKFSSTLGIKRVQQALNKIYELDLFQQIKIEYLPLELNGHNFIIYFILDIKNINKEEILKKICKNSIYTHIFPFYQNKNKFFIAALTNNKGFENMFNILENAKVFWLCHKESLPLLIKSNINYKKLIKKIK